MKPMENRVKHYNIHIVTHRDVMSWYEMFNEFNSKYSQFLNREKVFILNSRYVRANIMIFQLVDLMNERLEYLSKYVDAVNDFYSLPKYARHILTLLYKEHYTVQETADKVNMKLRQFQRVLTPLLYYRCKDRRVHDFRQHQSKGVFKKYGQNINKTIFK